MAGVPPREQPRPQKSVKQLVALLTELDQVPWSNPLVFDPARLVAAANQLLPEGKAAILRAMDEYLLASEASARSNPRKESSANFPDATYTDLLIRVIFESSARRAFRPYLLAQFPLPDLVDPAFPLRFPL